MRDYRGRAFDAAYQATVALSEMPTARNRAEAIMWLVIATVHATGDDRDGKALELISSHIEAMKAKPGRRA